MNLVRLLPERWHGVTAESAKFGLIGIVNMVVNFAVFNLLVLTVLPQGQVKASAIATIVATTGSYFMNRHWTYRHRPRAALWREYTLFFAFNLAGLIIEQGVLLLGKYGLGVTSLLALNVFKLLGTALGTVFRFWAYRTHVFGQGEVPVEIEDGTVPVQMAAALPGVQTGAFLVDEADGTADAALDTELDDLVAEAEQRLRARS